MRKENIKLKRLVAGISLDKAMLLSGHLLCALSAGVKDTHPGNTPDIQRLNSDLQAKIYAGLNDEERQEATKLANEFSAKYEKKKYPFCSQWNDVNKPN